MRLQWHVPSVFYQWPSLNFSGKMLVSSPSLFFRQPITHEVGSPSLFSLSGAFQTERHMMWLHIVFWFLRFLILHIESWDHDITSCLVSGPPAAVAFWTWSWSSGFLSTFSVSLGSWNFQLNNDDLLNTDKNYKSIKIHQHVRAPTSELQQHP